MGKHISQALPIQAKLEMAKDISEIIACLHSGQRSAADLLIEDLKTRATTVLLNDSIDYNNLKMDLPYIGFVEKACAKLNANVE